MKHMIISSVFLFAALWVFFPGARLIAAERYFISSLLIKMAGGTLLLVGCIIFALGATTG